MSRAIASYPKHMQKKVVMRRLRSKTKGLGFWAARDYMDKKDRNQQEIIQREMTEEEKEHYMQTGELLGGDNAILNEE